MLLKRVAACSKIDDMKKPRGSRFIYLGLITLLILGVVYGYSYAFKNKTVNEAAPTSTQVITNKSMSAAAKDQPDAAISKPEATPPAAVSAPSAPPIRDGTVATGNFRSAPGERAAGTVTIIRVDNRYYVRLEADTDIGASPDPIVTFGNGDRADLSINLGSLKGTKGSQNYEVPDTIDSTKYTQVIIYCRAFRVPIGYANLTWQ